MDLKTKTKEEIIELMSRNALTDNEIELIQKHLETTEIIRYAIYDIVNPNTNEQWFGWLHMFRSISDNRFHIVKIYNVMKDKTGQRAFKTIKDANLCYKANKFMTEFHYKQDFNLNLKLIYDGKVLYG